jgi:ribonuclease P protein component
MSKQRFLFSKNNRLCGKNNIQTLLYNGEAFFVYPYRIVYCIDTSIPKNASPIAPQVLVAVPKRKCKLAVQRNRIKRISKEAYRLLQHQLVVPNSLHLMLQYTIAHTITQTDAMASMNKIVEKLNSIYATAII